MMRRIWLVTFAVGMMLVLVSGCDGAASEVTVGEEDAGGEIVLGVGQVLVVELPGNPTTGFTWTATETPDFLTSLGEPDFEADSELVGASGMITVRFAADEPGSGTLELWYARPWESVQPEEVYVIDVVCR